MSGRCGTGAWHSAAAGLAAAGLVLAGCASIGPATVPADRVDYADALATSWKAQMLLNIVRLRYADVPTFMDVASIVSAYAVQGQVQAGVSGNFDVPSATLITPGGRRDGVGPRRLCLTGRRSPIRR